MKAFWIFIIIVSASAGWFGGGSQTASSQLNDVSWPQCGLSLPKAERGIVGVTGGLALRPNPCLATEAGRYKYLSVYVNTGYPGPDVARQFQAHGPKACSLTDRPCLAYNYGYNNGIYALKYALKSGVIAKQWWLDVETENSWDDDFKVNRANINGHIDALASFVGRQNVGIYSYPGQWDLITNKWKNYYPVWAATGSTEFGAAAKACKESGFTGGSVVMTQYTPNLDVDLFCSG